MCPGNEKVCSCFFINIDAKWEKQVSPQWSLSSTYRINISQLLWSMLPLIFCKSCCDMHSAAVEKMTVLLVLEELSEAPLKGISTGIPMRWVDWLLQLDVYLGFWLLLKATLRCKSNIFIKWALHDLFAS